MTRASLLLATICAVAASSRAAEVHWSELPKVLKGKTLVVGTKQGYVYQGRFLSSSSASLILNEQEVTIPRDTVKSIYVKGRDSRFSHLKTAGLFILAGYIFPFVSVFDDKPRPFLALITIPLATVAGAVSAPIGLIRDLVDLAKSPGEFIVILPDPPLGVSQ